MTFEEYQKETDRQVIKTEENIHSPFYYALGIGGEAGEVVDKVKKIWRDNNKEMTDEHAKEIGKELGDVLWYVSQMANILGLSLSDIAKMNIKKGDDRRARNTLHGNGDNR